MLKPIPHSSPFLGEEEIQNVSRIMASGQIAVGNTVGEFEQAFARFHQLPYAVAVSSGTAALHLALLALSVGPGDEVILPSYVCTAPLNAIGYVGAVPVLADIDPSTLNLDPDDVRQRITSKTRAIILPHMFGRPGPTREMANLGIPVIEDCAHAIGADTDGQLVGTTGAIGVFSFHATKMMTTGQGGMLVTASANILERVLDYREYDQKPQWRLRYNYRMTDIQASMGLVQLSRLNGFIEKRRQIAHRYHDQFQHLSCHLPHPVPGHVFFRYVLQLDWDVSGYIAKFHELGITTARPVFYPLHRYLDKNGFSRTDRVWQHSLSIPIYPSLSDDQIQQIIAAVIQVFHRQ